MTTSPLWTRADWLLKPDITFLNHGSFGALPRCVFEEQDLWRRRIEAEPVEMLGRRMPELIEAVKKPVGALLGMHPADFGLVTNATEAVNTVLRSRTFGPGDELVSTNHVYGAIRQTMRYVARLGGAAYREIDVPLPVESAGRIAQRVIDGLSPATRLLVIDHVTSPTALVFRVELIVKECAERGVDVLVDGAHAPGMLPLNVPAIGAAYYAGNLHKWCAAPKGSGFLWVRPDRRKDVHPLVISHYYEGGFAREFAWQGTRDFSGWLAIPRGLAFMCDLGWERVREHNHALIVRVHRALAERWNVEPISPADGELLGSMATLRLPPPLDAMDESRTAQIQQRLYDVHRIEAPIMRWEGRTFVRPCAQVYNDWEQYVRLGHAIEALAREA